MEHFPDIDFVAVIVATLAYYLLGALWYSKVLFQKPWMAAMGKSEEELKQQGMSPAAAMGSMFVVTLVSVLALAALIGYAGTDNVAGALAIAVIVSFGFLLPPFAGNVFFEGRPWSLLVINFGYHLAGTILAAIIIGLML